ncbi:hypothetical protein M1N11_05040 [Peptococcaceae bacterium]|nr:hypothetical protein [Peptococcaceae bacterium]
MVQTNEMVLAKIAGLYDALFRHNGFGEMRIEMRILKKGQKEVIIHCGKQYRFVVDWPAPAAGGAPAKVGSCGCETRSVDSDQK